MFFLFGSVHEMKLRTPGFSILMTGKTGLAVVHIAAHSQMFVVHIDLIVIVAVDAAKLHDIRRRVTARTVSRAASAPGPFTGVTAGIDRKVLAVMVKRGRDPRNLSVAFLAIRRKSATGMIRIGGIVVVIEVTVKTVCRSAGQIGGVALSAFVRYRLMRAQELIPGKSRVIKQRRHPGACVVTRFARRRELQAAVIRIGRRRVRRFVTRVTVRRRVGEYAAGMAQHTLAFDSQVRTGQREIRLAVIE